MPEIFSINPVVYGPFKTWDQAKEFLDNRIDFHPGTRGIVRRLISPVERPLDDCDDFAADPVTKAFSRAG